MILYVAECDCGFDVSTDTEAGAWRALRSHPCPKPGAGGVCVVCRTAALLVDDSGMCTRCDVMVYP